MFRSICENMVSPIAIIVVLRNVGAATANLIVYGVVPSTHDAIIHYDV